ncbi:hypothetical protein Bca52824_020816 [Brassica carinata]|uniref:Uncharacterized protein n=1 Tax=Brassica carinata TaxID=52824 RepID=A0A8X8AYU9_BRACI|nr:hypothetical protein Bca52824_020816 [Brassica carinata]
MKRDGLQFRIRAVKYVDLAKMRVEDLCVQAKEAALPGGGEALALTRAFQSISSIKTDCIACQQANDAQLSTMVVEQGVEATMSISVEAGVPRESLSDDKEMLTLTS